MNKINEIWMCALNHEACQVTYKTGKKGYLKLYELKFLLREYRKYLASLPAAPVQGFTIDHTLTEFFSSKGIVEIQFI